MLVIYNESSTAWERTQINDRILKYSTTRTLKDGKNRYIDILASADLDSEKSTDYVEMNDCAVLYDGMTNIRFQKKDVKPFIVTSDKSDIDILLITISLKGKILTSITNTKAGILNYMIARGELAMVVSVRDFGAGHKFEFTVHDPKLIADTKYTFTRTENKYHLETTITQVEKAITDPNFKIVKFRPSAPTNLILVNEQDKDAFLQAFNKSQYHDVQYYSTGEELCNIVDNYKRNKYDAITLFENGTALSDNYVGTRKMLKSKFRIVNVLFNSGRTYFI